MALSFPAAADTPAKRLAFCLRYEHRLMAWHRAVRDALPAQLSPAQRAAFKTWERDVWSQKMKRVGRYCSERMQAAGATISDPVERRATMRTWKTQGRAASTWDAYIDPEATVNGS